MKGWVQKSNLKCSRALWLPTVITGHTDSLHTIERQFHGSQLSSALLIALEKASSLMKFKRNLVEVLDITYVYKIL